MASRKFYWLKLQNNFFDRDEIKIVENMPNGKDYIIFYLKLLLKSVETEGKLRFRGIIPYTPEMLSNITGTNVDTVRASIKLFTDLQLMELWDDGTLFMTETQNMIGSETEWAKKKREYRNNLKKQDEVKKLEDNVQDKKDQVRQEKEIDIEIEKEIDIELEKEKEIDKDSEKLSLSQQLLENIKLITNNNIGNITIIALDKAIKEHEYKNVKQAIEKAIELNKIDIKYINGILKNWKKEGYPEEQIINKKVDSFNNYEQRSYNYEDLEKKLLGWDKE